MRKLLVGLTALFAVMAFTSTPQRVSSHTVAVAKQTNDSATVVASWSVSNADAVVVTWTYPGLARTVTATGGKRADTVKVAKQAASQLITVALTPKRGASSGNTRTANAVVSARVVVTPPPTVDSVKVDTVATVPAPVPVPTPTPAPTPTPTPTPSAFTPNLPAGLALIVDTKFGEANVKLNTPGADGLFYSMDAPAVSGGRNVAVATPWGTEALETYYPGNDLGNGLGGARIYGPTGNTWRQIYFAMSIWVPSNYSMHSNGEKWLYFGTTVNGVVHSTIVNFELNDVDVPNGSAFGFAMQPDLSVATYDKWIRTAPTGKKFVKGVWQTVEVFMQVNTPGKSDGVYNLWVDGQPSVSVSTVQFRSEPTQAYFDAIRFDGTRGGGASNTPTPAGGQVRRYARLAWYAR